MGDLNTWLTLAVAIFNAVTAVLVLLAKRDIKKIETATNSMKDALVETTAKAAKAEGVAEGMTLQRVDTAAALAAAAAAAATQAVKGAKDV